MSSTDLKAYLNNSSLRHALWRNIELDILRTLDYSEPILDVACGDGFFGNRLLKEHKVIGFDISFKDLNDARRKENYRSIFMADASSIPLKDNTFRTVFSNSVFEHIQQVDRALIEVSRVLIDNGSFIFTIPNEKFSEHLFVVEFLKKIRLFRLSEIYKKKTNEFLKHNNLDSLDVWSQRLQQAGLRVEKVVYYLPKHIVYLWDILCLPACISDCFYKIFKKRIKFPFRTSICIFLDRIAQRRQIDKKDGAAMVILAVKA